MQERWLSGNWSKEDLLEDAKLLAEEERAAAEPELSYEEWKRYEALLLEHKAFGQAERYVLTAGGILPCLSGRLLGLSCACLPDLDFALKVPCRSGSQQHFHCLCKGTMPTLLQADLLSIVV